MKDIERRLREDAKALRAEVDGALRERIRASVAATERPVVHSPPTRGGGRVRRHFGTAALVTGCAAAVLFIARPHAPPQPDWPATPSASSGRPVPGGMQQPPAALRAERVLLEMEQLATGPLEEEQDRLEADLEKLREELRRAF